MNAKARSMLAALTALLAAASAEPGGDPAPSASCPARAAAPLVYVYVPGSLGAATWAERQMEAVRLGIGTPARGEASASAVSALFSLHGPPAPGESGVEPTEAPREKPVQASSELPEPPKDASEEARILGALEAMGLKPEDLVEKPEMPAAALALADAIARLDILLSASRPREREVAPLRVDPEDRRAQRPSYVRHAKPLEDPEPKVTSFTLYAKKVTRSVYKMMLGVAIGILIWGFVRDTA